MVCWWLPFVKSKKPDSFLSSRWFVGGFPLSPFPGFPPKILQALSPFIFISLRKLFCRQWVSWFKLFICKLSKFLQHHRLTLRLISCGLPLASTDTTEKEIERSTPTLIRYQGYYEATQLLLVNSRIGTGLKKMKFTTKLRICLFLEIFPLTIETLESSCPPS